MIYFDMYFTDKDQQNGLPSKNAMHTVTVRKAKEGVGDYGPTSRENVGPFFSLKGHPPFQFGP